MRTTSIPALTCYPSGARQQRQGGHQRPRQRQDGRDTVGQAYKAVRAPRREIQDTERQDAGRIPAPGGCRGGIFQVRGHASITTTRKYYLAISTEDLQSASKWLKKILAGKNSD